MIPHSLTLEGFTGIRDGLRREALTLDFDALCPDAALVAIRGAHGTGKTTVLDNMTPFLMMPSHVKGKLSAFTYYQHVCLPKARKVLVWSANDGRRFRTEVIIRSGARPRTEAYLTVKDNERWVPVCAHDGTVSDGRVESYERCLAGIIGGANLFFAATFAAQGSRQLHECKQPDVKALLIELLDHQRVRKAAGEAAELVKLLRTGLAGLRQQLVALSAEEAVTGADLAAKNADVAKLPSMRTERSELQRALAAAQTRLADKRAVLRSEENLARRHDQLLGRRQELTAQARQATAAVQEQIRREDRNATALEGRSAARRAEAADRIRSLQDRLKRLKEQLAQGPAAARAARRASLARTAAEAREKRLETAREAHQAARRIEHALAMQQDSLAALERQAGRASLDAQALAERHRLSGQVPCRGTAMQRSCQLLGDARAAQALIPSAQRTIEQLATQRSTMRNTIDKGRAELRSLGNTTEAVALAESGARRARLRLDRLAQLATLCATLGAARRDMAVAEADLAALAASDKAATGAETGEAREIAEARRRLQRRGATQAAHARRQLEQLDRELADCAPTATANDVAMAARAVEQAADRLDRADRALSQSGAAIQLRDQALQVHERTAGRRRHLEEHVVNVAAQLGRWSLLSKCLGNDGLVALLIDDAVPELSSMANELLLACYGGRFTIAITTQIEGADGFREGLAVMVHDSETGTCKNVEHMSFGERIWINQCLVRAIALHHAGRQSCRHGCLFSDETDGSLDPERKRMFLAMKRAVLRLGGYRREFFITHTPELSEMADCVIDLECYRAAAPTSATSRPRRMTSRQPTG